MSDHVFKTFDVNGYTVKIVHDDEPGSGNPRDASNVGVMLANGHRNYVLGDAEFRSPEYDQAARILAELVEENGRLDGAAVMAALKERLGATVVLPLWLLDHSGLAMRTGPFGEDPGNWDSGIVGFIFDTPRTVEECGTPPELIEKALRDEVREYDRYLQGEVYGYQIEDPDGEEVEACWGFIGDEWVEDAAREAAGSLPKLAWVVIYGDVRSGVTAVTGPYDDPDIAAEDAQSQPGGAVMLLREPIQRVQVSSVPAVSVEEVQELLRPMGDS